MNELSVVEGGEMITPKYGMVVGGGADPAAVAAAETAKAMVNAAFIMAMQRPRNELDARQKILGACKRKSFAKAAIYEKPIGTQKVTGPSIRLAELAIREWGNVHTSTAVVFEDDLSRRIKVTCIDLETNATFSKEIQVKKTVERKSKKGREVVGKRINTWNETVYVVQATEDEMYTKESSMISKVIRNEGLRLIPGDIIEDAMAIANQVRIKDLDADPDAELKRVVDGFALLRVRPSTLEKILGQSLQSISPAQVGDLRVMYETIKSGDATIKDYLDAAEAEKKRPIKKQKPEEAPRENPYATKPPPAKKAAPKQEPETEPEPAEDGKQTLADITDPELHPLFLECKRKREAGFSTWLFEKRTEIEAAIEEMPALYDVLHAKWAGTYDEPFPLAVGYNLEKGKPKEENGSAKATDEGGGAGYGPPAAITGEQLETLTRLQSDHPELYAQAVDRLGHKPKTMDDGQYIIDEIEAAIDFQRGGQDGGEDEVQF